MAYASKEIIVCAGAIGSPLLLQRSGLGPKDLLSAAGIPLIRDLPVGMHFQDHVSLPLHLAINNASVVNDEDRDLTEANLRVFNKLGDGIYLINPFRLPCKLKNIWDKPSFTFYRPILKHTRGYRSSLCCFQHSTLIRRGKMAGSSYLYGAQYSAIFICLSYIQWKFGKRHCATTRGAHVGSCIFGET